MKLYQFTIVFKGGGVECESAFTFKEAAILACAKRIKDGLHLEISRIINDDTGDVYEEPTLKLCN